MSIHTGGTQVELLRWLLLSLAAVAALHASEIAWLWLDLCHVLFSMPGKC